MQRISISIAGPLFLILLHANHAAVASGTDDLAITQNDPYGFMMAIVGMGIVFTALLMLYVIFTNTPKLYTPSFKARVKKLSSFWKKIPASPPPLPEELSSASADLTGEVNAAIAAAIHLYRSELHDHENTVLTIKKVSRTYSPWSSKIYGLRNLNM